MKYDPKNVEFTGVWEYGYGNNVNDPGRETLNGISRPYHPEWEGWKIVDALKESIVNPLALKKAVETPEILKLTEEFYEQWWYSHHCDEMPAEIAIAFFDTSFMTGKAVWVLQRAINLVHYHIKPNMLKDDNRWGDKTYKVLRLTTHNRDLIDTFIYKRGKYQMKLQHRKRFYRGWSRRCFALGLYIKSNYNPKMIK